MAGRAQHGLSRQEHTSRCMHKPALVPTPEHEAWGGAPGTLQSRT